MSNRGKAMARKKRRGGRPGGPEWAEAKRRCRLSAEDVRKAKELGLTPRSPIKNIPSAGQRWKLPVREWVRQLYASKFPTGRR